MIKSESGLAIIPVLILALIMAVAAVVFLTTQDGTLQTATRMQGRVSLEIYLDEIEQIAYRSIYCANAFKVLDALPGAFSSDSYLRLSVDLSGSGNFFEQGSPDQFPNLTISSIRLRDIQDLGMSGPNRVVKGNLSVLATYGGTIFAKERIITAHDYLTGMDGPFTFRFFPNATGPATIVACGG